MHISSFLIPDYSHDVYDPDSDEFIYDFDTKAVIRQLRILHSFMVEDIFRAYEILYIAGHPKYTLDIVLNAYFTSDWMNWARKHNLLYLESRPEILRAGTKSAPQFREHVEDNMAYFDQTISGVVEFFIRELLETALSIENTFLDYITLKKAAEHEPYCAKLLKKHGLYLFAPNWFLCEANMTEDTISEHALEILGVYADILVEEAMKSKACVWHINLNFE